jgi:hypothetical protein
MRSSKKDATPQKNRAWREISTAELSETPWIFQRETLEYCSCGLLLFADRFFTPEIIMQDLHVINTGVRGDALRYLCDGGKGNAGFLRNHLEPTFSQPAKNVI